MTDERSATTATIIETGPAIAFPAGEAARR
jgi:hypothetical protein